MYCFVIHSISLIAYWLSWAICFYLNIWHTVQKNKGNDHTLVKYTLARCMYNIPTYFKYLTLFDLAINLLVCEEIFLSVTPVNIMKG